MVMPHDGRLYCCCLAGEDRVGAFLFEELVLSRADMDWMCDRCDCNFVSADVSKRKSAMEQNVNLVYAGRTLGMSETKFLKIVIPTAGQELRQEQSQAFARAMGEWGDVYAGRKYTRKDGDDRSERLRWSFRTEIMLHGRNLGFGCSSDRFCHYFL